MSLHQGLPKPAEALVNGNLGWGVEQHAGVTRSNLGTPKTAGSSFKLASKLLLTVIMEKPYLG